MELLSLTGSTSLVGIIAATIAFGAGLYQYIEAQRWKRIEFVAKEVNDFKSQPAISNVIKMLDYNERSIDLFPDEPDPANRSVFVTDEMVCAALAVHDKFHSSKDFTVETLAIRDAFDLYFEGFERFEQYISSGLVSQKEFEPYIFYDMEIMANSGDRKSVEFTDTFRKFITAYSYTGVLKLFDRYRLKL